MAAPRREDQALFALIQGGLFADLRRQAARAAASTTAPGFAIGGLSVGEPKRQTADLLQATLAELPPDRPRYLMGVGHPQDLADYARLGVDLFDCVLPTRLGRSGAVWSDCRRQSDSICRAVRCCAKPVRSWPDVHVHRVHGWSVGSLAALFQSREPLAYRLASVHNLTVLGTLAAELRRSPLHYVDYGWKGSPSVTTTDSAKVTPTAGGAVAVHTAENVGVRRPSRRAG